jgi:hypothetical protein
MLFFQMTFNRKCPFLENFNFLEMEIVRVRILDVLPNEI